MSQRSLECAQWPARSPANGFNRSHSPKTLLWTFLWAPRIVQEPPASHRFALCWIYPESFWLNETMAFLLITKILQCGFMEAKSHLRQQLGPLLTPYSTSLRPNKFYHTYVDDIQLHLSFPPQNSTVRLSLATHCWEIALQFSLFLTKMAY